jgi:outer membrane protein OmpA-like peptidoglycan-associated protein
VRFFVLLTLIGCATQRNLAKDYREVHAAMLALPEYTDCDPKERALFEASVAFTQLEFEQGNARRAEAHLTDALDHLAFVQRCPKVRKAAPPAPPPKPTVVDTDGDGVLDPVDKCVREPEDPDGFKDGDGCPDLDNDLDGVADDRDGCPIDAEDPDGFEDRDGCPEADNDQDGVVDGRDRCPNEAGPVAREGCPVLDRDGDGFLDTVDACPDAPEIVNAYLDEDGCPDTKPERIEVTEEQIVIKQRINFESKKARILPESFPVLDDVAQVLRDYPKIVVEIGGHTDSVGDDRFNQRLSKERADAVFEYLLEAGVAGGRMITRGYGETRPVDTNRTDEGRLNNRRVEFVIAEDPADKPRKR